MSSFKLHILELLSATGYDLELNPDSLNVIDSPFMSWFSQNVSRDNCISEEELAEFQLLQESGEVLYGEELDEALQEYYESHAIVPPAIDVLEDIKHDEAEHIQHQLDLQKQLLPLLRSSLSSLENDYQDQQEHFRNAEAKLLSVLKNLMAANSQFNTTLKDTKETMHSLITGIMELVEDDSKFMCHLSLHRYNKQHTKFSKLLKFVMEKHLNKMLLRESTPNSSLLLQNIMDRLFQQKQTYVKLSAQLAGIIEARNKVKETKREIQCHLWNPTPSTLRNKITELDDCNVLNDSEASFSKDEEELVKVCKKWADLQILTPISGGLQERIVHNQFILQKLEDLASIINIRLSIDTHLCNKMSLEYDHISNIIEIYSKVRDWLEIRVEESKTRMAMMKENIEDYNQHFVNAHREFIDCLALVLGCDRNEIPQAYNMLMEHSREHHQEYIQIHRQKLHTLASVYKDLKDFYFEEEEKKRCRLRTNSNQEHLDSIRQTLEVVSTDIETANGICHTLLE